VVSYFLRYFSSTSTEQISPIPPDLSPVSIRLALLVANLRQLRWKATDAGSSHQSRCCDLNHSPNLGQHLEPPLHKAGQRGVGCKPALSAESIDGLGRSERGWITPRQAPLRRLEISFSQGGEWKALISKYIGIIPLSGDVCPAAEHKISGRPPPRAPVSSAMIAKVGAAARYSQSTARRAATCPLSARIAPPAHPLG
jgi:hypothetical protein